MIGKNINGYEIIGFRGKGSFGTVYKCQKENRTYAIKIFTIDYVLSEFAKGQNNRVTGEIEALKKVHSDYVAGYIDDGSFWDNGWEYIYVVMDFVEGQDLETVMNNRKIETDEAMKIFGQILDGIESIHAQKLIHRDLKPANIYLLDNGDIKILDFGLSKLIDYTSITNTGDQLGTPLYMSPEQISDSKNIDYRSDYYAMGVILFQLLTENTPYGAIRSREELYYKIKAEPPISIRFFIPTINNNIDNLIMALLQKENYKRPNSIQDIKTYIEQENETTKMPAKSFSPSFYVRLYDDKSVLKQFYEDGYTVENVIFPINYQDRQKNLLKFIKSSDINIIIDPATMRLAYDTYADVKGLKMLPYAPKDFGRLQLEDLENYEDKKEYIRKVVDEQLKHGVKTVVAPFHTSNNSTVVKIKMDINENWFSLDVKLLEETKAYLDSINFEGKLVGGFCIKADILTDRKEREYFLNVLSGLHCDMYWIYVDSINENSNVSQLYNYATALLDLQKSTNKPVIAGRIGTFGLILLAFGLYAFESGVSRFESFYEELYKDASDKPYRMPVRYYIPELMKTISVERKNPIRIEQLLHSEVGQDITCHCQYCEGMEPMLLMNDLRTKKHFLYRRNEEIQLLRKMSTMEERVAYMKGRIENAMEYYKSLKPIFIDDDSKYLKTWSEVIEKLQERMKEC
ncbi:MAG: serine/threonine protein kinase [Lachnospiraceae bacterium]|nr:serine/threonine protein kinase [Lachnospiraceae bacterium]